MQDDPGFTTLFSTDRSPIDAPQAREASLAVLRQWYHCMHAKDLDGMCALMTEDVVTELPFNESGKTDRDSYRSYIGRDAVRDFWAAAFKAEGALHGWEDVDVTMNGDGSRVFVEARADAVMASGRPYRNRYVMRFDFRDGKVCYKREYYNPIQSAFAFGRPIAGRYTLDAL